MVDVKETLENDSPVLTIMDTEKTASSFKISRKHPTSSFFTISSEKGKVPAELDGAFTGLRLAEEAVIKYLKKAKPTATAKRNANTARREVQKRATKNRSKV